MRKTFTTIALAALLGTLAVSCKKENIVEESVSLGENSVVYMVH